MKKVSYIIIILIVLVGGVYLFRESKVKNVFDEMYYADVQSVPKMYTSTSFQPLLLARILKKLPNDTRKNYLPDTSLINYAEESLEANEDISVYFDKSKKEVIVIGALDYSNDPNKLEVLQIVYTYQIKSKKVTETIEVLSDEYSKTKYRTSNQKEIKKFMEDHDLTEKDLAYYQEYFLYEKLLTDWFGRNIKSRYSRDDLGEVEIIKEK